MAGSAPYSVRLDADVAQQLAEQGGTLLILDLPEGSYFGIDHMAFHIGPRFCGVKMLPPGTHFAAYSVPGSQHHGGGMGPLTGFFFHVAKAAGGPGSSRAGSVAVRRYDASQELLVELPEDEADRYASGVRRFDFDSGLAPYNLAAWRQWQLLSSCLDERLVRELQPVGGAICTAMEAAPMAAAAGGGGGGVAAGGRDIDEDEDGPETAAEARLRLQLQEGHAARARAAEASLQQHQQHQQQQLAAAGTSGTAGLEGGAVGAAGGQASMEVDSTAAAVAAPGGAAAAAPAPEEGEASATAATATTPTPAPAAASTSGRCFYTALPRLVKKAGLTPAQLTAANLDRTQQLEAAAAGRWRGDAAAVVGEMQFAFIAFVFGQSLQGFRQWRALVSLLLNCEAGPLSSHVPAFVSFLSALRAQLSLALTDAASGGAGQEGPNSIPGVAAALDGGGGGGVTTHGSLVEEVLLGGGGRDCFLRHHLGTFFEVMREASPGQLDGRLQAEAAELRALLSRLVGWQFDGLQLLGEDDDDEYAPVVVELPEGAELD